MPQSTLSSYLVVGILCLINLLNYMDRYTVVGVLKDIEQYFDIDHATSGLLQTAFICSYMIFAPVFGFLGDRYSRKWIIVVGVFFWSLITLMSSFVQAHHIYLFFFFRALVGIGEASYSTVAPTIIADLFIGKKRSSMIALFYFAIPVGSGLGYIVGSQMARIFHSWEWALRFTPLFGIISSLSFIFITEPKRGAMDGGGSGRHSASNDRDQTSASFLETLVNFKNDIIYLIKVPSYLFSTLGFTCVTFSVGALSWWAPSFMTFAIIDSSAESVNMIFGVIACLGGIFGVLIGSSASQILRPKYPSVDPLICSIGVFLSIPCTFISILVARNYPAWSWINILLAITFLSVNWSVVVDILLYVIVPNRRATAQAIQILVSHILGDAASPFIVGAISSVIAKNNPNDSDIDYKSLAYALYLTPFVLIFGGIFFMLGTRFLLKDEFRCKNAIAGSDPNISNNGDSSSGQETPTGAERSTLIDGTNRDLVQRVVQFNDSPITVNDSY